MQSRPAASDCGRHQRSAQRPGLDQRLTRWNGNVRAPGDIARERPTMRSLYGYRMGSLRRPKKAIGQDSRL